MEAFNGLLSLIPAKMYFGEDVSDQWRRKKQTTEEKRAAKRAKLDMNNFKSAKDVMEERERAATGDSKRSREFESGEEEMDPEMPREGLKRKKVKTSAYGDAGSSGKDVERADEKPRTKSEKRAAKKERRKQRVEKAARKRARQQARKQNISVTDATPESVEKHDPDSGDKNLEVDEAFTSDLQNKYEHENSSTASSPDPPSPTFDVAQSPALHSTSSSISSVQPPIGSTMSSLRERNALKTEISAKKAPTQTLNDNNAAGISSAAQSVPLPTSSPPRLSEPSKPSAEGLQQRLAARIAALRTARKADGLNGQPARSRQELLESRRRKEEERRMHKKELRRQAKEEEARKRDEEMARRFSPGGSGSLLASPMSPVPADIGRNSFSFGRVAFGDGSQSDQRQIRKSKGPSDPATALQASQAKHNRINGLDPEKKATIAEKNMWANTNNRVKGEKVRDDMSLLKKTLKRQEGKKARSEKEWRERSEGVQKAGEARQRKREENLRKRTAERGADKRRKGKSKEVTSKGKANVIKRPGFEGTFRGRTGGGGGKKNNSNN